MTEAKRINVSGVPKDNVGHTVDVVRGNLGKIRAVSIDGKLLRTPEPAERAFRLLDNYRRWGLEPPLAILEVHNPEEAAAAEAFAQRLSGLAGFEIVQAARHRDFGRTLQLVRERIGHGCGLVDAKRQTLFLTHRGGQGRPNFISPFTGGHRTTCAEWTRVVQRKRDGTKLKGFVKGAVAVGHCPVGCKMCFLQAYQLDVCEIALNVEDLETELLRDWAGWHYPINFGETGGLVELDPFFVTEDGEGSLVQRVIDACAKAGVIPLFLTKIAFSRKLKFHGNVKVGVSLIPEEIRPSLAPYGSPADELLESLAWAVSQGAQHPAVRLFVLWEHRDLYRPLLARCRDLLGASGWQLTVDIPRFTPGTLHTIAKRYPDADELFAEELDPSRTLDLKQIASAAHAEKKARPPIDRQAEIYRTLRTILDELGCHDVPLTACKGDPQELLPLVREGVIRMMPCACYNP